MEKRLNKIVISQSDGFVVPFLIAFKYLERQGMPAYVYKLNRGEGSLTYELLDQVDSGKDSDLNFYLVSFRPRYILAKSFLGKSIETSYIKHTDLYDFYNFCDRTDPVLIQVIEENPDLSDPLRVVTTESCLYRVLEDSETGEETLETPDSIEWNSF